MAYTIIQVSRKSGIPHSKLKFWLKKRAFFLNI
ncbi:MAG: helix-turn-helix domain-containing protein [Helicobacter sp.]|nr:helix-turn-helix domain-containing protein [Helicobacter sp.]